MIPWEVNHKKHKVLQIFFIHRVCRAFYADHFHKKIFSDRSIILRAIAKIARTREIQSFSILALAPSRIEQIENFFYKNDQHEKLNKIDYVKKF